MSRSPSYGKTAAEMDADHQQWLNRQILTASCALCPDLEPWTGPTAEVREVAKQHRAEVHPELQRRRRVKRPANPARIPRAQMNEEEAAEIQAERRRRLKVFSGIELDESFGA